MRRAVLAGSCAVGGVCLLVLGLWLWTRVGQVAASPPAAMRAIALAALVGSQAAMLACAGLCYRTGVAHDAAQSAALAVAVAALGAGLTILLAGR